MAAVLARMQQVCFCCLITLFSKASITMHQQHGDFGWEKPLVLDAALEVQCKAKTMVKLGSLRRLAAAQL